MKNLSRRKFLSISAIAVGMYFLPDKIEASSKKLVWEGNALGAKANMTLYHKNKSHLSKTIQLCVQEIKRLENIFSLYDTNSAITSLNKNSILKNPPRELLELINISDEISHNSLGAFDITVQNLWNLYQKHFTKNIKNSFEPSLKDIQEVKKSIGYKNIIANKSKIIFKKKNMAVTLNGIAQGYITDQITHILKSRGFTNVLIDLGEIRAIGNHPSGRDWNILTPYIKEKEYLKLNNHAIASSGGYGTRFAKNFHHLFNPHKAQSANFINAVSIIAPTATLADALSTATYVMPKEKSKKLLKLYPEAKEYISS